LIAIFRDCKKSLNFQRSLEAPGAIQGSRGDLSTLARIVVDTFKSPITVRSQPHRRQQPPALSTLIEAQTSSPPGDVGT
jgi:hypothetical protein